MIHAHRNHRHFDIPVNRSVDRSFNAAAYLDQQLALQAEEKRLERDQTVEHGPGVYSTIFSPAEMAALHRSANLHSDPVPHFRSWAVRLNDRIERAMDAVDWKRIDIHLGTIGGVAITGFALYVAYVVLDAWLRGRFNLGAN